MLLAHMRGGPTPIRETHRELKVPEALDALTMRLLEKDCNLRPANARELILEIERVERDL
jgi:hypothetical protein